MATNDGLQTFVHDALARGVPRKEVEDVLRRAGWAGPQVKSALSAFADVDFVLPVPRPRPYMSARDAFLYLILFTTLYICAFQFGSLVFYLIERAFPDPAGGGPSAQLALVQLRWAIAALVVAGPVYLVMARLTGREVRLDPSKRSSTVRRWLTYMTLFVGAAVVIGDLIGLVYSALSGELTVRFVLKALTVGVIAGGVFGYYLRDLRTDERGDAL